VLVKYVEEEGEEFQQMIGGYAIAHQERLIQGTCMAKVPSVYLAIYD
jgi:hypothetical protein